MASPILRTVSSAARISPHAIGVQIPLTSRTPATPTVLEFSTPKASRTSTDGRKRPSRTPLFLSPKELFPQRRKSDQSGSHLDNQIGDSLLRRRAFGIAPLRQTPLFLNNDKNSGYFSASKVCEALVQSPCRLENYQRQRRRLYHQDDSVTPLQSDFANKDIFATPKLGNGGFGSVYIGKYDGKTVAIKQLHNLQKAGESLCAELNAFRLNHPNIVTILTFSCSDLSIRIVYEYVGRQNLQQLLDDSGQLLNFQRRKSYCAQTADALRYCHANRVLHLDVKPANILVTDDNEICKLADFGCSRNFNSGASKPEKSAATPGFSASAPGTLIYKAPELLRGASPSTKADVYAFGFVLWQCATRLKPFEGMNPHTVAFCVVAKHLRPEIRKEIAEKLGNDDTGLIDLASDCWKPVAEMRPEFTKICDILLPL